MEFWSTLLRLFRSCSGREKESVLIASEKGHPNRIVDLESCSANSRESSFSKNTLKRNDSDTSAATINSADFWWNSTAEILQNMTVQASYSRQDQEKLLAFYQRYIVASLGPRPTEHGSGGWRSFMTDDFTPMEFSWNWGPTSAIEQPTIRFSIEAIGDKAGKAQDPWNMYATLQLMHRLEKDIPGCDCSTINRLAPRLAAMCKDAPVPQSRNADAASPSSMFMAFDLDGCNPTVKAYFLPFIHFATAQKTRGQVIRDFLSPYAQEEQWASLTSLLDFCVSSDSRALGIEPFMIAFDCVPLAQNRMKIYFRSSATDFASVIRVLSAHNDRLSHGDALEDLRSLWQAVFGVDPRVCPEAPLPQKSHETAGMLYYFEVRPGSSQVTAKVYLPAKHYGRDDAAITHALAAFFRSKQRRGRQTLDAASGGGEPCWGDRYVAMVQAVCRHRALDAGLGLHTYVTCSLKGAALDCTSYLNPEIYHLGRKDVTLAAVKLE